MENISLCLTCNSPHLRSIVKNILSKKKRTTGWWLWPVASTENIPKQTRESDPQCNTLDSFPPLFPHLSFGTWATGIKQHIVGSNLTCKDSLA